MDILSQISYIGWIHSKRHDYDVAIEYHKKALNIRETLGDKTTIAQSLRSISNIYGEGFKDFENAKKYFYLSKQIYKELGDEREIAFSNGMMAHFYHLAGIYDTSIVYLIKAYKIFLDLGESNRCSIVLSNVGNIYHFTGDYDQALEYYSRSLDAAEQSKEFNYKKRVRQEKNE